VAIGRPADAAPLAPWKTREAALQRDQEIQHLKEQAVAAPIERILPDDQVYT